VPRSPDSVEVFASAAPTEPFVDIALLEVTQHEGGEWRPHGAQPAEPLGAPLQVFQQLQHCRLHHLELMQHK
jgi:hypothetical protein